MFLSTAVDAKDPQETRMYTMDWTDGLNASATVSGSTWVVTGLTNAGDSVIGGTKTTVLLSGGTAGTDYTCTNTITTSDGETLERSGIVRVRAR
jgi:hypothetical protein